MVSGGQVTSLVYWAIQVGSASARTTVAVSGGFVFGVNDAIRMLNDLTPTYGGNAVVCFWNKPASGTPVYANGSSTDLNVVPLGTAAAWWEYVTLGDFPMVRYANGVNTGFISVSTLGVTVGDATASSGSMSNFAWTRPYTTGMFTDVNENEWYGANGRAFIKNAYEYGMVNGYTDGTFQPDANIKLSEVIVLAAKVRHIYNGGNGVLSMDLIPWYKNYVDYAIANGIITATTFSNYDALATRAQMAYIFSRCLPASEFPAQNTVGSLPDVSASTQYRDEIFMLYRAGVIAGNDAQGTFAPNTPITRAMVAGIISHIIIPSTRASGNVYG